ncbi:MAG TPA: hypothetical protein DEA51_05360 [Erysipelotrichaceae bacterium]|nr:hypothetical protein [Erysipelotrichaceae bacterium]
MKEIIQLGLLIVMIWMMTMIIRSMLWQRKLATFKGESVRYQILKPMQAQLSLVLVMIFAFTLTTSPTFLDLSQTTNEATADWYRATVSSFNQDNKMSGEGVVEAYVRGNDYQSSVLVSDLLATATLVYEDEASAATIKQIMSSYKFGQVVEQTRIQSMAIYRLVIDNVEHTVHLFEDAGSYFFYDESVNMTIQLESAS